jgi:hypothetical protein
LRFASSGVAPPSRIAGYWRAVFRRIDPMRAFACLTLMALGLALAGCGGLGFGAAADRGPSAPVSRVETTALPPLPGAGAAPAQATPAPPAQAPGSGPAAATTPPAPPSPPAAPEAPRQATGSLAGDWNALDRNGTSVCRIALQPPSVATPPPATPSGCVSQDLFRVAAWQSRGDEIILLAGNGAPIVLLRPAGSGRYEGETGSGERVALWR